MKLIRRTVAALVAATGLATAPGGQAAPPPSVCADCLRATLERLAGEPMRGRKCGSPEENAAARFIAEALTQAGVRGAAEGGDYLQPVRLLTAAYAQPPTLEVSGAAPMRLVQGVDFLILGRAAGLDAPALYLDAPPASPLSVDGKVLILAGALDGQGMPPGVTGRPAAVVMRAPAQILANWDRMVAGPPSPTEVVGAAADPAAASGPPVIAVKPAAMERLRAAGPTGARLTVALAPPQARTTFNVLGVIRGTAPDADRHAILLTAHYDHVGVRDGVIYPGANDDASGTAAVLEFARILGGQPPPKRTVYFGLFGCEEEGGLGARYFLEHPAAPLADIAANIEFEMIGARDPQMPDALMMTGFERSNLGPTLQAQGARIAQDRYPEQHFFERSDNIYLARRGVVAHTISAWPMPPTYHRPTDDLAHLDFGYMTEVVGSLVGPITWLANSDFRPAWKAGQQP